MSEERKTLQKAFWEKVSKGKGCWNWIGSKSNGYGNLRRKGITIKSHRISWELHFGKIPDGLCVCHHCDNPPCVRPDHLFLGTKLTNNRDMIRKGRFVSNVKHAMASANRLKNLRRGVDHPQSKLTEAQVIEARRLYSLGDIGTERLAKKFGVVQTVMYRIVKRQLWRHI